MGTAKVSGSGMARRMISGGFGKGNGKWRSEVMAILDVREAIEWQARHAEEAGAPCTARVVRAELAILDSDTATGRRMRDLAGPARSRTRCRCASRAGCTGCA